MNYENTGELGAEMGGKPVQHGTEVPPNAVRDSTQPLKPTPVPHTAGVAIVQPNGFLARGSGGPG